MNYERTECSRCHGSGQHSYCSAYGSVCFKCGGSGAMLTRRGQAAYDFGKTRCNILSTDVKVGDRLAMPGNKYSTVVEIKTDLPVTQWSILADGTRVPSHAIGFIFRNGRMVETGVKMDIELALTAEILTEIEEYQNNLTKAGTVRKIRKSRQS